MFVEIWYTEGNAHLRWSNRVSKEGRGILFALSHEFGLESMNYTSFNSAQACSLDMITLPLC